MSEPTLNYVPCADANGPRRMAYWQWGAADAAHTVVCVHGLSRQGRDFDTLARSLTAFARVVAVDVDVGHGVGLPQGWNWSSAVRRWSAGSAASAIAAAMRERIGRLLSSM